MARYRTSRLLPTILTIVIIIIAIAGLVALARLLFSGGGNPKPEQVNVTQQTLLDTSNEHAVSMTVRGPIVAQEDFRSYQIIISPTARSFTAYTGYLDTVTSQQTLGNNTAAYAQLVNALNKANMVAGTPFEGDRNDTLGICATGRVYEFRTLVNNDQQAMWWTSTCGGSPGSLKGSASQLSQLFLNQIPEGSNIANSLKL